MKQILIRFLLLFYISSSFLSATHVHEEHSNGHDDCKVCIVVKNLNSGDIPSFEPFDFVLFVPEEILITPTQVHYTVINKGFFSHAPPFSS